jgi:hypothetical protein
VGTPKSESVRVLRWDFRRGAQVLTCQVERTQGNRADYAVCIVPHWDVAQSAVESFDSVTGAFQRHADVAMQLRDNGWQVSRVPSESSEP